MAYQEIKLTTVNGVKSIPIRNMPPEAWTSVFGDPTDGDVYSLARSVPWLYRGINVIAEAVVNLPRNCEPLDDAGVIIDYPTLLNELVGDYLLAGAMFACMEENQARNKRTMRRFHPKTIKLITDPQNGLVGFERNLRDNSPAFYDITEIAYSWIPSRTSEIAIGDAPAKAAIRASGLLNSIDEHAVKYFEAGAINPTIAKIADFQSYPEAEQERTKSILDRLFGRGVDSAHRVAPVGTNIEFETIGSPMSDLAVPELTNAKREDISTALGIPQSLLFSNATNFATAQQDNRHFYEKTIIPLARKIETMFNHYFMQYGIDDALTFNEQQLEVFQTDEAMRSGSLVNLVNVGMPLTVAMEVLGYDLTEDQWQALGKAPDPMEAEEDVIIQEAEDDHAEDMEDEDAGLIELEDMEDEDGALKEMKPIPARYRHIDFYPNETMRDNARRGLELREKFGRGGTSVGIARGRQIAGNREILPPDVLSMYSYFRRHEVDKRDDWGNPSNPTNGYISWLLWGGDAGYTWATTRRDQMLRADNDQKTALVEFHLANDLSKWKRKAVKSYKTKDKPAVSFESDNIPSVLHASIMAQLETVTDRRELDYIFDNASNYYDHDHDHEGY